MIFFFWHFLGLCIRAATYSQVWVLQPDCLLYPEAYEAFIDSDNDDTQSMHQQTYRLARKVVREDKKYSDLKAEADKKKAQVLRGDVDVYSLSLVRNYRRSMCNPIGGARSTQIPDGSKCFPPLMMFAAPTSR